MQRAFIFEPEKFTNALGDFAQTCLASSCYVEFNSKEDCYCLTFLY